MGIEISQKQNRRRELTDKGLQFIDTVCCGGRKIYRTYCYCSPKCNGLQASIDVQLLVTGGVFRKYCYTTMKRAIIFHSRYTIVGIILERSSFVTMEFAALLLLGGGEGLHVFFCWLVV